VFLSAFEVFILSSPINVILSEAKDLCIGLQPRQVAWAELRPTEWSETSSKAASGTIKHELP
jgi:hypothetical protein